MPARFRKKVRKMRGSHTHGWGAKKKHRGSGSQAGVGRSNWLFSKRSFTYAYDKERLGKKGFTTKTSVETRAINLKDLDKIASKNNAKEIDVQKLGYNKVLGGGRLTRPLTIKAPKFTEQAKEKISEAGGTAVEGEKSG